MRKDFTILYPIIELDSIYRDHEVPNSSPTLCTDDVDVNVNSVVFEAKLRPAESESFETRMNCLRHG